MRIVGFVRVDVAELPHETLCRCVVTDPAGEATVPERPGEDCIEPLVRPCDQGHHTLQFDQGLQHSVVRKCKRNLPWWQAALRREAGAEINCAHRRLRMHCCGGMSPGQATRAYRAPAKIALSRWCAHVTMYGALSWSTTLLDSEFVFLPFPPHYPRYNAAAAPAA